MSNLMNSPLRFRGGVFLCLILTLALLLVGCTGIRPAAPDSHSIAQCLADSEAPAGEVTGVFIEPDDGYAPVLEELMNARCTVDVTIYMLTDDLVFRALTDAAARGVRVRVILDEHPFGMFGSQQGAMDRLVAGGVETKWSASRFQFSHANYIVIDSRVALVMNQNLTRSAFNGNREFGVVTTEHEIVAHAQELFDADWVDEPTDHIHGPLIVSPETSRSAIVSLLNGADTSVDFYAEVIRDGGIIAALEGCCAAGSRRASHRQLERGSSRS